ncbi:MAG TPA: hypothetical protein ENN33_08495 [Ignavibacteria bacterium]|nr:hypothetical protein [Ignavibacteria bacterium]
MKSKKVKEMTIEEKVQKFHERHPDYPKEFKSPAEEHLYLLNMLDEKKKENAELDKKLRKLKT